MIPVCCLPTDQKGTKSLLGREHTHPPQKEGQPGTRLEETAEKLPILGGKGVVQNRDMGMLKSSTVLQR